MVNELKFEPFSFSVLRADLHKMFVRIANREDPDQTASESSDLDLLCLSRPFWQATSVWNLRTSIPPQHGW